jgi:hypothetical protein
VFGSRFASGTCHRSCDREWQDMRFLKARIFLRALRHV